MDRVRKGVTSALLIATVYSIASAFILHFADVAVSVLPPRHDHRGGDRQAVGRDCPFFWNSVFLVPLGALIVWRYSIPGPGLLRAGHDGWRGRDDRPYRRGHRAGADAGLLWRRGWRTPPLGSRPASSCTRPTAGPATSWTTACWPPACTCKIPAQTTNRPYKTFSRHHGTAVLHIPVYFSIPIAETLQTAYNNSIIVGKGKSSYAAEKAVCHAGPAHGPLLPRSPRPSTCTMRPVSARTPARSTPRSAGIKASRSTLPSRPPPTRTS